MIMCYRVLMPCIICTRFAWFFWASKQKVEWEVWNKMGLPGCEKAQEVKCGGRCLGSAEMGKAFASGCMRLLVPHSATYC